MPERLHSEVYGFDNRTTCVRAMPEHGVEIHILHGEFTYISPKDARKLAVALNAAADILDLEGFKKDA